MMQMAHKVGFTLDEAEILEESSARKKGRRGCRMEAKDC